MMPRLTAGRQPGRVRSVFPNLDNALPMATVTSLSVYPVKSCRGIEVAEARIGERGLEAQGLGDRQWAVVDPDGATLTQREEPRLALVAPRAESGAMILSAPGVPDLRVATDRASRAATGRVAIWQDTVDAIDEGEGAAAWLRAFLGAPLRLARFDDRDARASDPARTGGLRALNRFSDGYPILLLSRASLADFNERWRAAGRAALPVDRFRPNIVIDGIGAYEEDHLAALVSGPIELRPVKACARCSIPSVDQATGEVGEAPVELLASYRFDARLQGATFGQNTIVARGIGSPIRIGQSFDAAWNF
jgi:uncharacterized protein YcbX